MGFRVDISDLAREDLRDVVEYIARENPDAAILMGDKLLDQAHLLSEFPERGKLLKPGQPVRKLLCFPYLILYEIQNEKGTVLILRFWHGARDQSEIRLA